MINCKIFTEGNGRLDEGDGTGEKVQFGSVLFTTSKLSSRSDKMIVIITIMMMGAIRIRTQTGLGPHTLTHAHLRSLSLLLKMINA